jgi:8-oxo-dGTP pyrophosphatase MutT (NUDIX family)
MCAWHAPDMPRTWRLLSTESVVTSPWFSLHRERLETGRGHVLDPFWRIDAPSWVCVVAITPDDRVVLVEQYRRGCDRIARELPAGNLEAGEDPAACAVRELAEETGFRAIGAPEPLGVLYAEPARSSARAYGFRCRVEALPGRDAQEASEDIATVLVPRAALFADPSACGMVHGVHHAFLAKAAG